MHAATVSRLEVECERIDREIAQLVAEMEQVSVEECRRRGLRARFMDLLARRGEVAREALVPPKAPQAAKLGPRQHPPGDDHEDPPVGQNSI